MAYVSVSRAQFDVQMYTNDAKALGYELSRDVSHSTERTTILHSLRLRSGEERARFQSLLIPG